MCPSSGTEYVSFELFLGILRALGPGTVPLQNPQVTSRKACLRNAEDVIAYVEQAITTQAVIYKSLWALRTRNRKKKVSKRVFRPSMAWKCQPPPSKKYPFGGFFWVHVKTFRGIYGEFLCRLPTILTLLRLFCDFRRTGPGDSCKWRLGLQTRRLRASRPSPYHVRHTVQRRFAILSRMDKSQGATLTTPPRQKLTQSSPRRLKAWSCNWSGHSQTGKLALHKIPGKWERKWK